MLAKRGQGRWHVNCEDVTLSIKRQSHQSNNQKAHRQKDTAFAKASLHGGALTLPTADAATGGTIIAGATKLLACVGNRERGVEVGLEGVTIDLVARGRR